MLWLILQRLKSKDPAKRRQAVERLAELESPAALAALANAVNDQDVQVRLATLAALGGMDHEKSCELLLRAMLDPVPQVRQAALGHLKDAASERVRTAVVAALRDLDPGVRGRAARFLEKAGWQPVDIEDEVWLAIAQGKMMRAASLGAAAIKPLESVLQGAGYSQQPSVVEALGAIPDQRVLKSLVRALGSPDHVVCLAAMGALANTGGAGVVHDLEPLLKHKDHRIRAAAIETLVRFDSQNLAGELCNLLRDPMWDVRCAAASALARVKDPAAVDALMAVLKDKSIDVRCSAANSLGRIGDARAIGPLVLAFKDNESEVRKMAAAALTQIDTKWAESEAARKLAPELRSALGSEDWAVRRAAAYVLDHLGEGPNQTVKQADTGMATPAKRRQQAVLAAFTDLLKDGDSDLRLAAVESLGRLGDGRARSPLMTALADADKAVRLAAAQALADLGIV